MKTYNNLNAVELYAIREYDSWKQSDCCIPYKLEMLEYWMKRCFELNIWKLL